MISIKKNSASATIANTIIIGESASDTFYLPSISGSDYIVSEASDGRIAIGDVILSGNALPKTDSNDVKIEGVWQLSGFDFHKVGSDLVIVKSGVDVSKKSVGKVTVKNFPFENSRGGFGITLGKTPDLIRDANGNLVPTSYDVLDKTLGTKIYFNGGPFLKTLSGKKEGFCGVLLHSTTGGSLGYRYRLNIFNSYGDSLGWQELNDDFPVMQAHAPVKYIDPANDKEFLAVPFSSIFFIGSESGTIVTEPESASDVGFSKAGIAIIDDSGKRVASQIVVQSVGGPGVGGGYFLKQPDHNDDYFFNPELIDRDFFYFIYNKAGQRFLQKVDLATLENLGEPIAFTSNSAVNWSQSNVMSFSDGNKITIVPHNGLQQPQVFRSELPKLRDLTPAEIISNRDLASGKQTTNPNIKKQILSFTPDSETNLEILPNPNSVLEIFGRGDNSQVKMSFPVDHHSQIKIHSTTDADYTLEQLLNGEFDFSVSQELPISRPVLRKLFSAQEEDKILKDPRSDPKLVAAIWTRRLGGEEEVNKLMKDSAESARLLRLDNLTNSTDDDYSYGYGDYFDDDDAVSDVEEIDFNNLKTPITVIKLQLNETESQTVILHGVNATEVAKLPEAYFLTQFQITNSPTSNPSKNPSGQPSSNPSSLLTNEPTNDPSQNPSSLPSGEPTSNPSHKPTAGELIMPSGSPTGQPTLQPFSDPSAIPSYRPQAIPSYNPTGKPTGNPTNNPSKDPTSNPSRNSRFPTNIPSYSKDTSDLPTSKPSMEELTNQPSSQPSNQATNQESNFPSLSFPSSQPSKQSPSNVPFVSASPSSDSPITTTLPPTIAGTNQDKDQNHQQTPSATLIGGVVGAVALVGLGIAATVKFLNRKGAPDNRKVYADEGINIDIEGNNRSGGNGR